ncbi:FecCD family ABC transporter permease [Pelotomaculum propionicicum]|uniref:Hemin transport system permease protein HmuU n=1 Tax=Pelotomaculum propionicicum TaxID=258475 RepID=A0A4Y7RP01_9FIRM|nr:iron ABC transporter permease [Pelotomaculum propionicicum]TEB10402.1 Hemin transport system permease protein HmuU [Pelotomaculum propionicicum]
MIKFHIGRTGKILLLFVLFGLLLILFVILSIVYGSVQIPLQDLVNVLLRHGENIVYNKVVWDIRFPRALASVLGGAALAVSGLLLQIFFRNPIVDSYVLGVSSGATLIVAVLMLTGFTLGIGTIPSYLLSAGALVGALAVVLLIVAISCKVKQVVTLLVIGLMIGYICSAVSSILVAFAEKENLHNFVLWTLGSFSGFGWDEVIIQAIAGGVLMVIAYLFCKSLNALLLGENYARSMGVNIRILRIFIVLISSALAALVTAFAGPVAFIGLAAPHLARLTLGTSDNKILIPATIILGALITTLCDFLARITFSPVELPISAVSSLIGAPIVIVLLMKRRTSL